MGDLDARIVCSTDDEEIASVARCWGAEVPFMRPANLASDEAKSMDVVTHLLQSLDKTFDLVALIQPTSPLLEPRDVLSVLELHVKTEDPVISVAKDPHPIAWSHTKDSKGRLSPVLKKDIPHQRQLTDSTFAPNGAVYVAPPKVLIQHGSFFIPGKTRGLELPAERSLDIDTENDLQLAEALLANRPIEPIQVGDRTIGPGHPCYIIAEAGVNHNGDLKLAKRLVDAAVDASVDAVKFQTFRAEKVVSPKARQARYQQQNTGVTESQLDMVKCLQLSDEEHAELFVYCRERNITFLSTPFDLESLQFLLDLGVPAIKMGSGELTNHDLLKQVAKPGLPILLSTGMSHMHEVDEAIASISQTSSTSSLALLHCVSNYPSPAEDSNLAAVDTLRRAYGVPCGWSDHTMGIDVAIAAVARGSSIIEKHFTLDRTLPGPDHKASLEPKELRQLAASIRAVESAIGDGVKRPVENEKDTAQVARRSLHATRDLPAGTKLSASDLIALRPGTGIPVKDKVRLIGKSLQRHVSKGEMLEEKDFE